MTSSGVAAEPSKCELPVELNEGAGSRLAVGADASP